MPLLMMCGALSGARLFGRTAVVDQTDTEARQIVSRVLPCSQATLLSGANLVRLQYYEDVLQRIGGCEVRRRSRVESDVNGEHLTRLFRTISDRNLRDPWPGNAIKNH